MKHMVKGEGTSLNFLQALSDAKCAQPPSLVGSNTLKVYFIFHFSSFCGQTFDKRLIEAQARKSARTRDVKQIQNSNGCVA